MKVTNRAQTDEIGGRKNEEDEITVSDKLQWSSRSVSAELSGGKLLSDFKSLFKG